MKKYKLEKAEYDKAIVRDIKTGEERAWPYEPSVEEISYQEMFLDKVVDPDTGEYNPERDEEGRPVKTTPDPKYSVNTIIRLRRNDDSEFLLSKGTLIGMDIILRWALLLRYRGPPEQYPIAR